MGARTASFALVAIWTLVGGVLVAGCGDSGETADPTAGAIPTATTAAPAEPLVTATTAVATTRAESTTTLDPAEAAWLEIPEWGTSATLPRQYRSVRFEVPFAFDLPAGWESWDDEDEDGLVLSLYPSDTDNVLFFHRLGLGSVNETVTAIEAMEVESTEPEPITIGGAAGVRLRVHALAPEISFGADRLTDGTTSLLYVVDVAGDTVVIQARAFTESFDLFEPKTHKVIDSVMWKVLR